MGHAPSLTRRAFGRIAAGCALATATAEARARTDAEVEPPDLPGRWELAFADEFDGEALDRRVWSTAFTFGRTISSNHELQWYEDGQVRLGGGRLRLVADRRRAEGRNTATGRPQSFDYVSGMVTSFGSFAQRYGYFEARARLPRGQGLWPAFWLLPRDKDWPPEIDVLEYPKPGGKIFVSNHFRDGGTGRTGADITGVEPWFDPTAGFHRYAVDWRPDEIVFYLDGRPVYRSRRAVPDREMYVLANLAIGGNWAGPPVGTTSFPATLEVDFIRVWRRVG